MRKTPSLLLLLLLGCNEASSSPMPPAAPPRTAPDLGARAARQRPELDVLRDLEKKMGAATGHTVLKALKSKGMALTPSVLGEMAKEQAGRTWQAPVHDGGQAGPGGLAGLGTGK